MLEDRDNVITTPRIKCFINTCAPAYSKLDGILSVDQQGAYLNWADKEKSIVVLTPGVAHKQETQYFTLEELGEACPTLSEILRSSLSGVPTKADNHLAQMAKTLWNHDKNPGILIAINNDSEMYTEKIDAILEVNLKKNKIKVRCSVYVFSFLTSAKDPITTQDIGLQQEEKTWQLVEVVPPKKKTTYTFSLALLEKSFPGCGERARHALALGIPPEDVPALALDATFKGAMLAATVKEDFSFN